jgi:DNA-binding NarL/FixJ family response regulator
MITIDLDPESICSLHQAFPTWTIETHYSENVNSPDIPPPFGVANLLVLGIPEKQNDTAERCRQLRRQVEPADTPILVLIQPGREALVRRVLEAGADSCLILPRAQEADDWRDEGGEC